MRSLATRLICLCVLALAVWSPARSQAATTWTTIDYPSAFATFAQAINNSGMIVGGYTLKDGTEQGFLYADGQFSAVSVPNSKATVVTGINDSGIMVGYYSDEAYLFHSFVYDGQTFTLLDYPGAVSGSTILSQINIAGTAVGNYMSGDGASHGFSYANGVFTSLEFPGATGSYAYSINSNGDIAGAYTAAGNTQMQGFIKTGAAYHTVNFPKATNTSVRSLNDSRQFVGIVGGNGGATAAFGYFGKFQPMLFPGSYFNAAYGLNNAGAVVGYYIDAKTGIGHGFLQTP